MTVLELGLLAVAIGGLWCILLAYIACKSERR